MNKIKRILIGACMLALSGSAAAIMVNEDGTAMGYADFLSAGFIQQVIEGDFGNNGKRSIRVARLENRLQMVISIPENKTVSAKREIRLEKRGLRLQNRIAKNVNRALAQLPDTVIVAINGTDDCDGQAECGSPSVPEPSTIALLGLGLVGIGAARRLRKKARSS